MITGSMHKTLIMVDEWVGGKLPKARNPPSINRGSNTGITRETKLGVET